MKGMKYQVTQIQEQHEEDSNNFSSRIRSMNQDYFQNQSFEIKNQSSQSDQQEDEYYQKEDDFRQVQYVSNSIQNNFGSNKNQLLNNPVDKVQQLYADNFIKKKVNEYLDEEGIKQQLLEERKNMQENGQKGFFKKQDKIDYFQNFEEELNQDFEQFNQYDQMQTNYQEHENRDANETMNFTHLSLIDNNQSQSHLINLISQNQISSPFQQVSISPIQQNKKQDYFRPKNDELVVNEFDLKREEVNQRKNNEKSQKQEQNQQKLIKSQIKENEQKFEKQQQMVLDIFNFKETIFDLVEEFQNENGFYDVQNFGQLLIKMNILHPSDIPIEKIGIQIIQREMDFVDELWKNIKLSNNNQNTVSKKYILELMQILTDFKRPLEIISSFLEAFFQETLDILQGKRVVDFHSLQIQKQYLSCKNLILEIRFLVENNKQLIIQKEKEKKRKFKNQNLQTNINSQNLSNINQKYEVHQKLYENHKIQQKKIDNLKENFSQKELENCTFKPILNKNLQNKNSKPNTNLQQPKEKKQPKQNISNQENLNTTIHDRLFQQSMMINEKKEKNINDSLKQKEFEMEQCTFRPQINKSKHLNQVLAQKDISEVKGLNLFLERKNKAKELKEYKENFFERKQNQLELANIYIKNNNVEFNFNQTKINVSKNPIPQFYIDIGIYEGKQGRVGVYEGDDTNQVVERFDKIYHLNQNQKDKLLQKIQQILSLYQTQQQQNHPQNRNNIYQVQENYLKQEEPKQQYSFGAKKNQQQFHQNYNNHDKYENDKDYY